MLDRPGRKLGAKQQQYADPRRLAVDDGMAFAAGQIAAAGRQHGPRHEYVPAEGERNDSARERCGFQPERDVGETAVGRRRIRRHCAERGEAAARGDQTRTSRP